MHVCSLYGYILTRVYCQIPDSKGVKRSHPSGHLSLLASGQIHGKNIYRPEKYIYQEKEWQCQKFWYHLSSHTTIELLWFYLLLIPFQNSECSVLLLCSVMLWTCLKPGNMFYSISVYLCGCWERGRGERLECLLPITCFSQQEWAT